MLWDPSMLLQQGSHERRGGGRCHLDTETVIRPSDRQALRKFGRHGLSCRAQPTAAPGAIVTQVCFPKPRKACPCRAAGRYRPAARELGSG